MALRLLQGPIDFANEPGDPDYAGLDVKFSEGPQTFWLDEFGLVGPQDNGLPGGGSRWCIANLDAIISPRASGVVFTTASQLTYDYHKNKLLHWDNGINIPHTVEPLTCSVEHEVLESAGVTNVSTRLPDRWMKVSNPDEIDVADLDAVSNAFTLEYTFDPNPGISAGSVATSPGPGSTVFIWCSNAGGVILQYDWLNKTEIFPRRTLGTDTTGAVWYSRRFDIFIRTDVDPLNTDLGQLYIYANEFEPSTLSAPVALTPVTQGRVSTIQTTLADDVGTGIPDRRIDWSITVGNGTLSTTQSVTDEDGVAEVDYRAELSGGVNPTIQAQLTY